MPNTKMSAHSKLDESPTLLVNGAPCPWTPGCTLATLLDQLGTCENAVATAVNGEFVTRLARRDQLLAPGDAILLFEPIVGG